jgi:hypothetical protein
MSGAANVAQHKAGKPAMRAHQLVRDLDQGARFAEARRRMHEAAKSRPSHRVWRHVAQPTNASRMP